MYAFIDKNKLFIEVFMKTKKKTVSLFINIRSVKPPTHFENLILMKNLLLLIAMLITTSTVFSQLFVRPNPTTSTDSYIYVKDEILFVEQDVNLEVNSAGDTEASIYLREGAQLIQGSAVPAANSGTGMLSVYQNAPWDDSWDYTYWCSPIGDPAGIAGNTNFGITKIYDVDLGTNLTKSNPIGTTTAWNGLIGDGTAANPLTISTRWTYSHETPGTEAESHYVRIYANNVVTPGFGFVMKGVGTTNHDQNYDFRGRPNNGTFSIPVSGQADVYGLPYWTLTGNPYPSAIDLAMVVNNNAMVSTIYFWDEDRTVDSHYYSLNRAGFAAWIPASPPGGTYVQATLNEWDSSGGSGSGGTGGLGVTPEERRFAPIGQGFMLAGMADGSAITNATINNSMRVYVQEGVANESVFRNPIVPGNDGSLSTSPPTTADNRWPQIRILTAFGESHAREMVLLFSDESTDGYDHGMDALHPMDATSEAYFPIGEDTYRKKYVIQTVPFALNKRIPINFVLDQQFNFSVTATEEINTTNAAFLWDNVENTYKEITGGNEAVQTLPAGDYDNRFFIVFRGMRETINNSEGTIAIENARASVGFFQNNPYKQMEITNPEGYTIKSALVYDMSGRLVINKTNLGSERNITLSTSGVADGVYLIKLITSENIDIDYKTIIRNE